MRVLYNAGQTSNEVKRNPSLRNYKKQNLDLLTVGEPAPINFNVGGHGGANGIIGSYDGIYFKANSYSASGTSTGSPFMNASQKSGNQHREQFTNPNVGNKIDSLKRGVYGNMPNYIPHNKNQLLKGKFFTPFPGSIPLPYEQQYQSIPDKSMFVFAKNKASPYCHSSFSTSTGQICSTAQQRALIGKKRGNNKTYYDDSF